MSDCIWKQEDEDSDVWYTDCGQSFCINEGCPSENRMIFCCYCGNPLIEELYTIDEPE